MIWSSCWETLFASVGVQVKCSLAESILEKLLVLEFSRIISKFSVNVVRSTVGEFVKKSHLRCGVCVGLS